MKNRVLTWLGLIVALAAGSVLVFFLTREPFYGLLPRSYYLRALQNPSVVTRIDALRTIAWFGADDRASLVGEALVESLHDKYAGVRIEAARALARRPWDAQRAVPALTEALQDTEVLFSSQVIQTLEVMAREDDTALRALADSLQHRYLDVPALKALADLGPRAKPTVPCLLQALNKNKFGGVPRRPFEQPHLTPRDIVKALWVIDPEAADKAEKKVQEFGW